MAHSTGLVDALLRVAGRLLVLIVIAFATIFLLGIALKPVLPAGLPAGRDGRVLFLFLITIALGVAHLVASVVTERGRWEPAGLGPRALRPAVLLSAPGLGLLAVGLPLIALLLAGWARLEPAPSAGSLPVGDVITLVAAATLLESLAFRGYLQGLLETELSPAAAVLLPAIGATAFQYWGRGVPLLPWLAALCSSILLGVWRWRSQSVVAVWLAQLAVVLTLTLLLRAPVPQVDQVAATGVDLVRSGPALLTGGRWGLMAGFTAALASLLLGVAVGWPRAAARPPQLRH